MDEEKKLKGFLIDLREGSAEEVEFVDNLDTLYQLTNCDCIDITVRKVGQFEYDIVCDDEGLLKGRKIVTAFNAKTEPMLVGNLLFCNHDEEGGLASLSEEQIKCLKNHIGQYLYDDGEWVQMVKCVINMDYC